MNNRAIARRGWGGSPLATEWTIREVLNWTRGYFEGAGIAQPRLEAEILLAHTLGADRLHLYLSPDKPLTQDEREAYRSAITERRSGTPLQHIIGEVTFYGLRFRVRSDALVPRPETEELLDHIMRMIPRDRPTRCLDLGTGTGVISICLARYLPEAEVTATDISSGALHLAMENAELNGVAERIRFVESDWFSSIDGCYDLVVSNPPYVPEDQLDGLSPEVRDHEPQVALNGGPDGLVQIRNLMEKVPTHLAPEGIVVFEVGHDQGSRVSELMAGAGLVEIGVQPDLTGKDRFVVARCPS